MRAHDLFCFSHLRWDFVLQRPNHLMTRCAQRRRVFYIEEPVLGSGATGLERSVVEEGVQRVVPHLGAGLDTPEGCAALQALLLELQREESVDRPIHWFYSPMFLPATETLRRAGTVYDCMDELTGFLNAPSTLAVRERALMARADVMFTGGRALYEAKRAQHGNVHCTPSSVDLPFFQTARTIEVEPEDQVRIGSPRIGYYGVIDERIDLTLIEHLADSRPDWHIIMLGPVAKVSPEALPRRPNIHYLGQRPYKDLPRYASAWDVAIMPFALNDATRFISPTKTPEYLAAGLPVVSTAVHDVVEPYEGLGLVRIARTQTQFVEHIGRALSGAQLATNARRDTFLRCMSWDETWRRMELHMTRAIKSHTTPQRVSLAVDAGE